MTDRVTGPLFKWFGSKWNASKRYPAPIHDSIVEPFAGSAGYSLRHHRHAVTLAESNARLLELWTWLICEATEASIRDIPIDIPEGTNIRELGMSHGQALLLKNWQRTNNVSECWTVSSWGNLPGQWTANTRARVASEFHLVKHWTIVPHAFALMEDAKAPRTWFLDPPYEFNYDYGTLPIDYPSYAVTVRGLPGQVIACEAVCQETGAVPDYLPFVPFARSVTSRRKATNNHHSQELIYTRSG